MKLLYVFLLALALFSCGAAVDDSEPIRALTSAGYTDVHIVERHWGAPQFYGCAKGDDVAFECTAKNPKGQIVTLTVCSSFMFKASTIRF
jgi:hypothetical protein